MTTLLQKALEYHKKFGWNIIPVGEDKKALVEWKNYEYKKMTEEDIQKSFISNTDKIKGIAVITGQVSGITAIDLDINKIDGYSDPYININTPSVISGSGGKHYYFKYNDGLGSNSFNYYQDETKKINEIKNNGRYLILPPSQNKKGVYRWVKDFESTELKEIPKQVIDKVQRNKYQSTTLNLEEKLLKEGEGRNNYLTSELGKEVRRFRKGGFKPEEIQNYLIVKAREIQNNKFETPLLVDEVQSIINSIIKMDLGNYYTDYYPENSLETNLEPIRPISELEESLFNSAFGDGTKKVLGIPTGYKIIDEDLSGFRGLTIVAGEPKIGKSSFMLQTSYQASLLGTPVIYLALEMSEKQIYRNICSMLAKVGNNLNNQDNQDIEYYKNYQYNTSKQSSSDTPKIQNGDKIKEFSNSKLALSGQNLKDNKKMLDIREIVRSNNNFFLLTQRDLAVKNNQQTDFIRSCVHKVREKIPYKEGKILLVVDMLNHFIVPKQNNNQDQNRIDASKIDYFNQLSLTEDISPVVVMQLNKEGQKSNNVGFTSLMGSTISSYTAENFIFLSKKEQQEAVISITLQGREVGFKDNIKALFEGEYRTFKLEKV